MNSSEKYRKKYSLNVVDRSNSIKLYNSFLEKFSPILSLESLIDSALSEKNKITVFDLGCGEGQALKELKEIYKDKIKVMGLDLLPAKAALDEFIEGSALEKDFPKEVDLLFSFRAMHEMDSMKKLIEKIISSLALHGKAVLSIRLIDLIDSDPKFSGEITAEDIKFLQKILREKSFLNSIVSGKEVLINVQGVSLLTGIYLLIEKN
ncbi:MAG TPA: class I SAM-dependent methyltransferase [archaeon]|nr:class I SAM-dependent methyltransferase [archaeon]